MRLGLTQLDPKLASSNNNCLPMYALPDLANLGTSWIYPVTMASTQSSAQQRTGQSGTAIETRNQQIKILSQGLRTSRGLIPRSILRPMTTNDMHPMDTGSRVGVIYVPSDSDSRKAEMHFIINGVDQGSCTSDIPFTEAPLHAVVDVYGTTKQVKIIQLNNRKEISRNPKIKVISTVVFYSYPQ